MTAVKSMGFFHALKKYRAYYLLALPGLLYLLIFRYVPMAGLVIAFKDISPFSGIQGILTQPFVGFRWFQKFFHSYYFWNILGNTIGIRLQWILFGFPVPIILALSLNEVMSGGYKRVIQTVSYIPYFFSSVVVAGLVMTILTTEGGLVNNILRLLGREPVMFLASPKYFRSILVVTYIWQGAGWGSIVYLAAITGIDPQLYESAGLDGAGRFQKAVHITVPCIASIIVLLLILNIGNLLEAGFEIIFLLYSEPVYKVADVIDTYVYRSGLIGMQYSFATAVGLFKSIVAMILLILADFTAKRLDQPGLF